MSINLNSRRSKRDFPAYYKIQNSVDGKNWSDTIDEGYGNEGTTKIEVDDMTPVKFLRINQTGSKERYYWSINELSIHAIPEGQEQPKSLSEMLMAISSKELAEEAEKFGDATHGAELFYGNSLACAKCHDAQSGPRLGPNLAIGHPDVTPTYLVESVLDPSKVIHKDFKQVKVLTFDGVVISGYLVREDDDEMVVREPAAGKEIVIPQDDIEFAQDTTVSAMPPGLVSQLTDQSQFADLVKFLIDVNEGGEKAMKEFRAKATDHPY